MPEFFDRRSDLDLAGLETKSADKDVLSFLDIVCLDPGSPKALENTDAQPQVTATPHDAHIADYWQTCISELGNRMPRRREFAQRLLESQGPSSLASLERALGSSDAEVRRRSEVGIGNILSRMTNSQLMACRDEDTAGLLVRAHLGDAAGAEDLQRFNARITAQLGRRIRCEPFSDCTRFLTPTEPDDCFSNRDVVRNFERLATAAGQGEVLHRIKELEALVGPNLRLDERTAITSQMERLRALGNRDRMASAGIEARVRLSFNWDEGDTALRQFTIESYSACTTALDRHKVISQIVWARGFHEQPGFMEILGNIDRSQGRPLAAQSMIDDIAKRKKLFR
jgi:hypothetical protein